MKLAFSTLACPGWSVEQVVQKARQLGYDGIEWRLIDGEVIDPRSDAAAVEQAVRLSREAGLDVCALDTSCQFNQADPEARARQVADATAWITLAERVQVLLLRVFGGPGASDGRPAPSDDDVDGWVADGLRQVAPLAEKAGVTVVLETHDAFSSARRVARILDLVGSPSVAALWDSHHPYRVGETVDDVAEALDGRIAHVHVKDARRLDGSANWQLVLLGEGEVPVREQLRVLADMGYQGYISVEWEKKWQPQLAEPEVALPQQLAWLRQALAAG